MLLVLLAGYEKGKKRLPLEPASLSDTTSVMQYKVARKPLPQVSRELNAGAVVEGSIVRFGDRVRVSVQLLDGAKDQHLWEETYERDFEEIPKLWGEVAAAIARESFDERPDLLASQDPAEHSAPTKSNHILSAANWAVVGAEDNNSRVFGCSTEQICASEATADQHQLLETALHRYDGNPLADEEWAAVVNFDSRGSWGVC